MTFELAWQLLLLMLFSAGSKAEVWHTHNKEAGRRDKVRPGEVGRRDMEEREGEGLPGLETI